jgi:hypothetical protein
MGLSQNLEMMRKVGFEPTRSVEHRDIHNLRMWALFEIYVHKIKGKYIRSFLHFQTPSIPIRVFECPASLHRYL